MSLHVFYNISDLDDMNVWILYKESTRTDITRKNVLFQLTEELSTENKYARHNTSTKQEEASSRTASDRSLNSRKRNRCQIGFCKEDNKTSNICNV